MGTAAFFRLEGALSRLPSWAGAAFLASSAPNVRKRLLGPGGVALSAALARRDPKLMRSLAWSTLRGLSEDRIAVLGADWAKDRVVPGIAPEARRLARDARAAGRLLVLVSESIEEIAKPVGEALGFDRVIA